jgi:hypothetical protein
LPLSYGPSGGADVFDPRLNPLTVVARGLPWHA